MAISFETVTGNQTSANVLAQINNNFAKINSTSVPKADFATNADTVDNKHASELIPGAATFLNSISTLANLSVGRYFCTQTRQSWEPVTTTGNRTFLIEVSLNTPNNLKSYKITYIAGAGAGESYYSDYKSGNIDWNRVVTDENIENLIFIYNYLIFNNRKVQPVLAQDGFYSDKNSKTANLITDDGTKYFIISASAPASGISTITVKMYNMDTNALLATQTVTQSTGTVAPTITNCFSDNNTILFYTYYEYGSGVDQYYEYVFTFSENSLTMSKQNGVGGYSYNIYDLFFRGINNSLTSNLNDSRYSNNNYIIYTTSDTYETPKYYKYNKLTKEISGSLSLGTFSAVDTGGVTSHTMYPRASVFFVSRDKNIFCGIGDENDDYGQTGTNYYRPGGFIFNIDSGALTRLALGSINSNLNIAYSSSSTSVYGGVVIVGDFVYVSADLKYNTTGTSTLAASGIFKFNASTGAYVGRITYSNAGQLKLLYKDSNTILCYSNSNIFEIDINSFTIKNNYGDIYTTYILNPAKTSDGILLPPLLLNEKYHKIAVQKGNSNNNNVIAKINYYMGYNDYWRDIGGI